MAASQTVPKAPPKTLARRLQHADTDKDAVAQGVLSAGSTQALSKRPLCCFGCVSDGSQIARRSGMLVYTAEHTKTVRSACPKSWG